jgi:hypothetical protein
MFQNIQEIKLIYEIEPYLKYGDSFESRRAFCRLRFNCHKLQIEKGRYTKIPVGACDVCKVTK